MKMQSKQVNFFDTHCHLQEDIFDDEREKIIEKMLNLGVDKFMLIGTSVKDSEKALKIRDHYPNNCYVAVAIDPTSTQKYVGNIKKAEDDFAKIAKLARENNVSAIGETGLDRYWRDDFNSDSLEIQHLLFGLSIDLAKELDLPLVIHQREALNLTLSTLKEKKFTSNDKKLGVFHSFTGNIKDARRIVDIGFYLGINGIVTFKSASQLQGAVKNIGSEDLLYETDAPYLTPEPHRGQRNDSTYIPTIAEFIESLKQESISDEIYQNSTAIFH